MEISSLYPNFLSQTDRRKLKSPVEVEQRSGKDRRVNDNPIFSSALNQRGMSPAIDPKLEKD
jgi:hypothetical protein